MSKFKVILSVTYEVEVEVEASDADTARDAAMAVHPNDYDAEVPDGALRVSWDIHDDAVTELDENGDEIGYQEPTDKHYIRAREFLFGLNTQAICRDEVQIGPQVDQFLSTGGSMTSLIQVARTHRANPEVGMMLDHLKSHLLGGS